ncbi:hypothetical protein ACOSQ3_009525 [Xanthoceras sorbifolium]
MPRLTAGFLLPTPPFFFPYELDLLRDNIQRITKPAIRCLARKGGISSSVPISINRRRLMLSSRRLHGARQEEDGHGHGCRLRVQEAGQNL